MELPEFLDDEWHHEIIAHIADTPGEYRLPAVLLVAKLAETEHVAHMLEKECALLALKLVLRDEKEAYMRSAAVQALIPFAKAHYEPLITDKIIAIALRLALQDDCDPELYQSLISLFTATVEHCDSIATLMTLLTVKARTRQGARGLPPKLTKRIVYRTDYLLSNGYGFPEELSRYDLTRVTPYTSDMSPEAVDVRSTIDRLLTKCSSL
jgi:hypothetical protein